jgi:hypothetical protein
MACVFGAVSLMPTNAEAQTSEEKYQNTMKDADELIGEVGIFCLNGLQIYQLITEAREISAELKSMKSDPGLPDEVDPEIDGELRRLDRFITKVRKMACPPPKAVTPPEPVRLNSVGTLRKPAPEGNGRAEIGWSGHPWLGPGFGLETIKNSGQMNWTESDAVTGQVTNQGSVRRDPLGVGFTIDYGFAPRGDGFIVDPFVSFDYLGWSINQTFPGGSFLGTKSNFDLTGGVKIGPTVNPSTWIYAIAGMSALNETLNINFVPLSSSITKTVPGATLGVGAAIMPGFLQGFGHPVSLSLEYQHTWWETADYNTPAASPFSNYSFKRDDDAIKLGFKVYFSAPPPVVTPSSRMPLKAPPAH